MNVWKDCIRVMSMLIVPTHWEVFHVLVWMDTVEMAMSAQVNFYIDNSVYVCNVELGFPNCVL